MKKKFLKIFMVAILAIGTVASLGNTTFAATGGPDRAIQNPDPGFGAYYTETIYISNEDLAYIATGSGGATAAGELIKSKSVIAKASRKVFGFVTAGAGLLAFASHFSGHNGYTITNTYHYEYHRDGFYEIPEYGYVIVDSDFGMY